MFSRHLVQIYLPIIDSIILLRSLNLEFLMMESPASSRAHVKRNLWKAFLQTLKLSWLNLSNPSLFPFFTPVDPSSLELRAWEGMNRSRLHLSLGLRVLAFFFLIARWSSSCQCSWFQTWWGCQLLGVLGAESLEICFNTFLKFHLTWDLLEAGVSIMRKSRFNECSKIIESIHVVLAWAAALQSVAVRRSTCNDVSGPLFSPLFFFHFPFSVATFSHRRSARIKKLI